MAKKREYTNKWMFNGQELNEVPAGAHGFVYLITDKETGMMYLGKKSFWSKRKLKPTDKRRTTVESDWQHYWSSSDKIKAITKAHGTDRFERRVLAICQLERHMNYLEVKYQFAFNILEQPARWYNDNINGCWYPHLYSDVAEMTTIDERAISATRQCSDTPTEYQRQQPSAQ